MKDIMRAFIVILILAILCGCKERVIVGHPGAKVTDVLEGDRRIVIVEGNATSSAIIYGDVETAMTNESSGRRVTMTYSGDLPERSIRWIQIVVRAPIVAGVSRPNFDDFISKKENDDLVNAGLGNESAPTERRTRIAANNPFMRDGNVFTDRPSHVTGNTWDSYIILCFIVERDNPDEWSAQIGGIWHWVSPNDPVRINDHSNQDFQNVLNGAKADFGNTFDFGMWYPRPVPNG